MKSIWTLIHEKHWSFEKKVRYFLISTVLTFSCLGLLFWFALHFFVLNELIWAICFIVYFGFFVGFLGGAFYLYRHNI